MKNVPTTVLQPIKGASRFFEGSRGIGDGKIRTVVSQGVTSGFGHLLGKDLPPSPTLFLVGAPDMQMGFRAW